MAIQVLVEPLAAEQYRVQFFFYLCVVLLGLVEAFGCIVLPYAFILMITDSVGLGNMWFI